ncbi:MAG: Hsp20/alpha crystallin family protein [Patescibacteria group bacterium]|nr:Hsp20/alpha crystallin family protein [Patescibacteria group bacterium]MDE2014918.1 Hsp20/alpha crystallin family protein [Patescibacteria group bacterium]MDE2226347.1 Hsp20/alpha crystallin family protein [Patescibacteria group bacterium]
MDNNDDKFFETLANEKAGLEGEYKVELAKAQNTAVRKPAMELKEAKKEMADEPEGQLTIDVYQTPADIVVESAVAGVKPEDIDINVTNDSVTIRGERHREKEVKDDDYFYQECYWGRFARSVVLPQEVDPESAEVVFKNGILTVRLPKLNRKKSKKLKVRVE